MVFWGDQRVAVELHRARNQLRRHVVYDFPLLDMWYEISTAATVLMKSDSGKLHLEPCDYWISTVLYLVINEKTHFLDAGSCVPKSKWVTRRVTFWWGGVFYLLKSSWWIDGVRRYWIIPLARALVSMRPCPPAAPTPSLWYFIVAIDL